MADGAQSIDPLRAFLDERDRRYQEVLDERDRRYQERFEGMEQAVRVASEASERRFESVNEFRAQQADLIRGFLPRAEYERAHSDLVSRMAALTSTVTTSVGERAGQRQSWILVVGIFTITGVVFGIVGTIVAIRG